MRVGNEFISWRAEQPVYLKVSLATLNERLEIFSTTLWAFEMGRFRSAPLFRTRLQRDQLTHFRQYAYLVGQRSEEHTSELQSLMRISYAVFCLKKKKKPRPRTNILRYMKTQVNIMINTTVKITI